MTLINVLLDFLRAVGLIFGESMLLSSEFSASLLLAKLRDSESERSGVATSDFRKVYLASLWWSLLAKLRGEKILILVGSGYGGVRSCSD